MTERPLPFEPMQEHSNFVFAALAETRQRLRERAQHDIVEGSRLAALLESTTGLERVYQWAAEMQLGAEGFDNMTSARLYRSVQEHVLAAARELSNACELLNDERPVEVAPEKLSGEGSDRQAVIAAVERFLAAVGDGDLDALPEMFAPKANIGAASLRNGKWTTSTQTFDEWYASLKAQAAPTHYCEPVSHYTIHLEDGQIAFVRADATLLVDGQVHSHNIDYFTLVRHHGAWKFLNASYTATRASAR